MQEAWASCESDHARISQFTVQQILGSAGLVRWAAVIGAHHGRIKGERVSPFPETNQPAWNAERCRLAGELIRVFGPLPTESPDEATLWMIAGLITFADWLGSNEDFFPQDAPCDLRARRVRAREALDSIGWRPVCVRTALHFEAIFPGYSTNPLQSAAIQTVQERGLYIIEGPMGSGKTEAALAAAYQLLEVGKATGIYFGLPTQVTSNRIYLRVQEYLQNISTESAELRLAHSASWLVQTEPPPKLRPASNDGEAKDHVRVGRSWFASPKRALLAPFGVGTIDQALLGIVAAKHFFLRQFGLAGKVVVLDEVHTYDLYTSTLIDVLVRRLRELQCTVIVLSATLTEARRRQLLQVTETLPISKSYPLVSGVVDKLIEIPCEPPPSKTVAVRWVSGDDLVEKCVQRAQWGQCVLWIRNTVDDAQETYRRLMAANYEGGPEIALLHSRFPFFRREELEAHWIEALGKDFTKRPAHGCVLVSTQVAEQSVDIDADLLITDLAPTDMVLQRLGRLWRHERAQRPCSEPEIWIQMLPLAEKVFGNANEKELREAFGKSARVYAPYVLLRSLEQWRVRNAIMLPGDIRPILEATYADPSPDEPMTWRQLREQLEERKRKLSACALSATSIWNNPALADEEGVQTRYESYPVAQLLQVREISRPDTHSAQVRLLSDEVIVAHDREWNFDAAKAIHRNLTRIPLWAVAGALADSPGWLTNHVVQPTAFGLLRGDGTIHWPDDEAETGLSYHQSQGIIINRERVHRVSRAELDESYD